MDYFDDINAIKKIIDNIYSKYMNKKVKHDIFKNVIDPFSSLIESSFQAYDYDEWIAHEKTRQLQKTLQNMIGTMHEEILGNITGVRKLKVGKVTDIVVDNKKIIAEIKNKFNTTKGNHKVNIYDDLSKQLTKPEFKDYTAYYVEIIPKKAEIYNKPFTPPDNTSKTNRPTNQNIRQIDGKSFYALLTNDENAIYKIHNEILSAISNLGLKTHPDFITLMHHTYGIPDQEKS